MSSIALIRSQIDKLARITKAYENHKKSPKDRLAKESYHVTRLETLEEQWKVAVENHKLLQNEESEVILDHKYFKLDMFEDIEEVYTNYKSDLKEALSAFRLSSMTSNRSNKPEHSSKMDTNVRLPKITIPTFSGTYTEWQTFRDLYVSLIHENTSLDNVQKMHYLKGHLSGEAEQLLRHVPITAANYQESWSLLNSRYNNKKHLANCLLKRFMDQSSIRVESSNAVRNILDTTNDTLNGLKNLGVRVESWDVIMIYIICTKLDSETRKQWEAKISISDELPTLQQMQEFLESRFRALEFLNPTQKPPLKSSTQKPKVLHAMANENVNTNVTCPYCKQNGHKISNCKDFSKLDYNTRHNFVQTNALCFNCLGRNHSVNACHSSTKCRVCKHKHHSLLHPKPTTESRTSGVSKPETTVETSSDPSPSSVTAHFSKETEPNQVLLATAIVKSPARNGNVRLLRALLDQGSQASFVTESTVQLLGLQKTPTRSVISGLGGAPGSLSSKHVVTMKVQSNHDSNFQMEVRAHVLSAITSLLPSEKIVTIDWPELAAISLADPQFNTPNKIDILLGADVYGQIMRDGLLKGPNGALTAQRTALGWILSGPTHQSDDDQVLSPHCHHNVITSFHAHVDDNELLKQFWQLESDSIEPKMLTQEEQLCEEFYSKTTRRDPTGRYIVCLPFREDDPQCKYGNSRDIAHKRFHLLEQRFKKNPEIKASYCEVMQEYLDLGHMEQITGKDERRSESVYLPHHAVIRQDKSTSKVRVVFDASCVCGKNGESLNASLMVGPTLQHDLRHIIMRWRTHPICLCADIVKMYRQVIVSKQDADFQRLVWRDDPESETKEFRLVRVTFGTASAPYLAVKTLQQLATDEGEEYPETAKKIKTDFYVDDLLTGCQTVDEGIKIYREMKELLSRGGFELQKWVTNDKDLAEIVMEKSGKEDKKVDIKTDEVLKILGLYWDKGSDSFQYSVQLPNQTDPITKRKVISDISRLFDPLGWVAPCVIVAKVMIQKLWLAGIDWDEELPDELLQEWLTYRSELLHISEVSVPRWVNCMSNDTSSELHGFCDASMSAYAAAVYLRTVDAAGSIHVNLVAAKTKVAPTMQISIPGLELMGAVLLAKLITEVAKVLNINNTELHGWTDSTVVLAWLSSHPSRWTTFIGNRTSEILSKLDNTQWAHVRSAENPADLASRGSTPTELAQCSMWLQGPSWLRKLNIDYIRPRSVSTDLEQRKVKVHLTTDLTDNDPIWNRFSSLRKLVRVVAFCRRFLKIKDVKLNRHKFEPFLTSFELNEALHVCIKQCQTRELDDNVKLKPLNPYHDDKGILRAQGRLQNSTLPEDTKHPIILPHTSHLTALIVRDAHICTLHGGPSLMLSHLRTKYWIVSGKSLVKNHVRKCVKCVRHSAKTKNQFMGQLPSVRVTPARPFLHSGVDFAGPINIRMSKGRGNRCYKGYISLFVCMVTKAIHLEAVSDLTADGFIACFKRFVARRGHVSDIWSDNGTNFVGASKELQRIVDPNESAVAIDIREWLSTNSVTWHFIPPHAPNHGGLWEAGVKSTKFHLKRIMHDSTLTFEEMTTVLSQVEACLNSRPLSVLPESHAQPYVSPLTAGHFLIGEPLVIVPEPNYERSNITSLKRWQLMQRMVQHFWQRWSNEYLVHCLQRYKWSKFTPEPNVGDVVLVKEDNLPPARWLLGKVVKKHPGLDNITRVVTLKCKESLIKRPTSKLCVLPVTD